MRERIVFADLFAGCGGLSSGFHNRPEYKLRLATDNWNPAEETYKKNFIGSDFLLGDISQSDDFARIINSIGSDLDLLIGGPPCVGFSTLNNSKKASKQNTLVDVYIDVVEELKPKVFLIENVRTFSTKKHPSGTTYPNHVKNRLRKISPGYNYIELILNAHDFGIPQKRVRYFFLATRKDVDAKGNILATIEKEILSKRTSEEFTLKDAIGDLPKVPVRDGSDVMQSSDGDKVYNHKSMNHSKKLENRFKHIPQGGGLLDVPKELLTDHLRKMVDGKYGSGGFMKNIYGRMEWDSPSGTIVAGMDKITCGRFVHPEEDRLLTPRECARIQTFPDDFVFTGGMVSQYYQIGNAVPPKLSAVFASSISKALSYHKKA